MPPRLARLLAVVAAVALVAGAFAVRSALAGDDETVTTGRGSGPGGDGDGDGGDDRPARAYRIACDEDLGAACDALVERLGDERVTVVRADDVLAAAAGDTLVWDAWLTLDGLGGVLDSTRQVAGLPAASGGGVEVASSPLVLLAQEDPPGGCAEDDGVSWTCLIDPPGAIRAGVAVPGPGTALGILSIAAAATALAGGTDFDRDDFDGTPEADAVRRLLDRGTRAGDTTAEQTAAMFRPGTADAAVTTRGLAQRQAGTVQGQGRDLRGVDLAPPVVVGVALVGLGPEGDDAVAALDDVVTGDRMVEALVAAGWSGRAGPTTGLPEPDVIYALWEELGS